MRKTILATMTVILLGAGVAAIAQPAPGGPGAAPLAGPPGGPPGGPMGGRMAGPMRDGPMHNGPMRDGPMRDGSGPGPGADSDHGPGMMGRMHGHHADRPFDPRAFGLVYRQADRRLTSPDVQKIAEAFLLWNGNHTWKVTEVAPIGDKPAGDAPIGFAIATPEGGVIARFTMDPHTGRVTRTG